MYWYYSGESGFFVGVSKMNQLVNINQDLTMSSLDIVKVINAIRKQEGNNTELRHSDFLEKVKQVLNNSAEFSAQYKDSTGRILPCYNFPKRESMLMAMSYSYSVQAAVYDAYVELEAKNNKPLTMTEMLIQQAIALDSQAKEIEAIKNRQLELEAKIETSTTDYYTVAGYCSLRGKKTTASEANLLGRKCAKLSKELDYSVNKQHSEIFGQVNAYHIEILAKVVS